MAMCALGDVFYMCPLLRSVLQCRSPGEARTEKYSVRLFVSDPVLG